MSGNAVPLPTPYSVHRREFFDRLDPLRRVRRTYDNDWRPFFGDSANQELLTGVYTVVQGATIRKATYVGTGAATMDIQVGPAGPKADIVIGKYLPAGGGGFGVLSIVEDEGYAIDITLGGGLLGDTIVSHNTDGTITVGDGDLGQDMTANGQSYVLYAVWL